MCGMRRLVIALGFLGLVLLPIAAAALAPDPPPALHVAIAQPIAAVSAPLMPAPSSPRLSETGLLVLIGSALMGLGTLVRRTTRIQ